jgi:hypothetical protein
MVKSRILKVDISHLYENRHLFIFKPSKLFSLGVGNSLTYESCSHSINASTKPLDYTFYFFITK